MRTLLALTLLLAGCSDYGFTPDQDPDNPGRDGTDGGSDGRTDWEKECDDPTTELGNVQIDESCEWDPEVGSWNPVIEWTNRTPGNSYTTPVVGNLTDDNADGRVDELDVPDIVVANAGGELFVLSGDDGRVHWRAAGLGAEPSTPAVADVDGDGVPDVVGSGSTGFFAWRGATGAPLWHSTVYTGTKLVCGGVSVYDLDGDGKPEVVQGAVALNGEDGSLHAAGSKGWGTGYTDGRYAAFGVVADTDQDGTPEIITGNAAYGPDGRIVWENNFPDGFVAVGNFDDDPYGEVVVTWYPGLVRLQDHDGSYIWGAEYTGRTVGPPTVADFDGDGEPEIGVAGNGVYVVIEGNGDVLWTRPINDFSSGFTGSAVFDFEGDGKAEVVFADEQDLWVFDGATGSVKLQETRHSSATCSEYPAVADVDNDGHAEIIYSSGAFGGGTEAGVTVVGDADDSWQPGRPTWNQHAYHITNVSDSAGGIPRAMDTNWHTYNTFRSGDLSAATGGAYSDAVPVLAAVCLDECDDGNVEVVVQVGNMGVADLPAGVPFSLYTRDAGRWRLLETRRTPGRVPSGSTTPSEVFALSVADLPEGELKLVVDDDGGIELFAECHEDNNEMVIEADCG